MRYKSILQNNFNQQFFEFYLLFIYNDFKLTKEKGFLLITFEKN
jgi:hypothetical protein